MRRRRNEKPMAAVVLCRLCVCLVCMFCVCVLCVLCVTCGCSLSLSTAPVGLCGKARGRERKAIRCRDRLSCSLRLSRPVSNSRPHKIHTHTHTHTHTCVHTRARPGVRLTAASRVLLPALCGAAVRFSPSSSTSPLHLRPFDTPPPLALHVSALCRSALHTRPSLLGLHGRVCLCPRGMRAVTRHLRPV